MTQQCRCALNDLDPSETLDHQQSAMTKPPDQKVPACAVPQAAQRENHNKVEIGSNTRLAITAEWNVDVVAEPA